MTFIDPIHREKVLQNSEGKKTILLPNGDIKIDATRYAWDRDAAFVHPALKLAIQYKMLEDFLAIEKKENMNELSVRNL
jgi:hypothetical protein